jgi:hypothetical protein
MFSTPESLKRRTGKSGIDRPTYLKQLIDEYENQSTSELNKEQILANLANFSYDPINYEYFRRLNVLDIFIKNLKEFKQNGAIFTQNLTEKMVSFSLGGICNLCLDQKNKEYLLKNGLIKMVYFFIEKIKEEECLVILITILVFLYDKSSKAEITSYTNGNLQIKKLNDSTNKRISNIARVFTEDCLEENSS